MGARLVGAARLNAKAHTVTAGGPKMMMHLRRSYLFLFLAGQFLLATAGEAAIDQTTKDRALVILERIEARDPLADDRFVESLERRVAEATGLEKLRAMHELLYFKSFDSDAAQAAIAEIHKEAKTQNNESYAAIGRSRLVYLDYKQSRSAAALGRLEVELADAQRRYDWLAETQIRRLITYLHWSESRREAAMQTLQTAFERIPPRAPESDFARITLLDALEFIHADSGDLTALIETAEQILDLSNRSGLPVNAELIVRDFAYLFRLRGEYEIALRFYQAYDRLLQAQGQIAQRYIALFGLAITAQRMEDFALSHGYAEQALESEQISPIYRAAFRVIQSINAARLGNVDEAKSHLAAAEAYFADEASGAGSDFWEIEMLRARAELARAAGRAGEAIELMDRYLDEYIEMTRQESAQEVESLRAELSAELARQRAERSLLERDQQLAAQRVRAQRLILGLLVLLITATMVAYIQQRRSSRALDRSRRRAEAANEAKSRFLANISHELRTPLNAVIGFSDLLGQAGSVKMTEARVQEYAGLINQSGRHLLDVIADLLDISQIEAGGVELSKGACTLSDIVEDAMGLVAPQAKEAGKRIERSLPDDLPVLLVDRRRMKQVVINLLSNALKFTRRDARITLSAWREETGGLAIAVTDNGIGIPPDKLETVLDPFVQIDDGWNRTHHGVGLGLSIVRSIVTAHGGRLDIESQLGTGTCITITLPPDCLAEAAHAPPGKNSRSAVA